MLIFCAVLLKQLPSDFLPRLALIPAPVTLMFQNSFISSSELLMWYSAADTDCYSFLDF